jgi:hypothetical protein
MNDLVSGKPHSRLEYIDVPVPYDDARNNTWPYPLAVPSLERFISRLSGRFQAPSTHLGNGGYFSPAEAHNFGEAEPSGRCGHKRFREADSAGFPE